MYHFYVLTLSTRLYFLCLWHLFFVSERHPVGSCRSVIMRKNLDILFQEYKKNTQDLQARNCQASLNSCACECTDNTSPFFRIVKKLFFIMFCLSGSPLSKCYLCIFNLTYREWPADDWDANMSRETEILLHYTHLLKVGLKQEWWNVALGKKRNNQWL